MKLPERKQTPPTNDLSFSDFDAWGGAIANDGKVYVKECRSGDVILKERAIPYRRGLIKKKVVFYYLIKGELPPAEPDLKPSTWEEYE